MAETQLGIPDVYRGIATTSSNCLTCPSVWSRGSLDASYRTSSNRRAPTLCQPLAMPVSGETDIPLGMRHAQLAAKSMGEGLSEREVRHAL